ncbi:hypothetical protein RDABS01_004516 [Bienertia sinuspersici]
MTMVLQIRGTILCLGGAITLALYKGRSLKLFSHPHQLFDDHTETQKPHTQAHTGPTWIKGVFILLTGNTFWALWLVMQVKDSNLTKIMVFRIGLS